MLAGGYAVWRYKIWVVKVRFYALDPNLKLTIDYRNDDNSAICRCIKSVVIVFELDLCTIRLYTWQNLTNL